MKQAHGKRSGKSSQQAIVLNTFPSLLHNTPLGFPNILCVGSMRIFMQDESRDKFCVVVDPTDTVAVVKSKIEAIEKRNKERKEVEIKKRE